METHNLMGMVAARVCEETVTCVYIEKVEADDGSADTTETSVEVKASITPLQAKDIERLQMQGLQIQDGVTAVLPFGAAAPDRLDRVDGSSYRIVNFSDVAGATVCTCDKIALEAAVGV